MTSLSRSYTVQGNKPTGPAKNVRQFTPRHCCTTCALLNHMASKEMWWCDREGGPEFYLTTPGNFYARMTTTCNGWTRKEHV